MPSFAPIPNPSVTSMEKLSFDPYKNFKFIRSFMKRPQDITTGGRVGRWFAKQVYNLTGKIPGMGKLDPKAQRAVFSKLEVGRPGAASVLSKARQGVAKAEQAVHQGIGTEADVIQARKVMRSAEGMKEWADTSGGSLPGVAKALVASPEIAKRVLVGGWKAMPTWQKATFGGLTGKGMYDVVKTPSEEYGKPGAPSGRLEHLGREVGSGVGWLATGGLPLVPMMLGAGAATAAGGLPGRMLTKRRQAQMQQPEVGSIALEQLPPEMYG